MKRVRSMGSLAFQDFFLRVQASFKDLFQLLYQHLSFLSGQFETILVNFHLKRAIKKTIKLVHSTVVVWLFRRRGRSHKIQVDRQG